MNWISRFLTSSLGQKVIMSLTGIFLILFLIVHMSGNLQLLAAVSYTHLTLPTSDLV